ncbi:MAG: hypothetical protein ACI9VM_000194 [Candidatus Azotimanducaceae bacterium]|jgi:hypothetical protein
MIFQKQKKGALLVLVLVFGAIFFIITSSYIGYIITQHQTQQSKYNSERALGIAEAGIDYYKWYLAHFPDDTTNGTGVPGPYVIPYTDPETAAIGEFSLEIASTTYCGDVASINITSTGYTYDDPDQMRTIYAKYARPTVAEYSYIINANVWAGPDRVILGPYYSNGHIRMDGTNNSTVSSGQASWVCDGSYSCSPDGSTVSAVFGDGPNFALWEFPSPPINFTGLLVDLASMLDRAQNGGGIYIPPSGNFGYRVDFQSDGTVDIYVVDSVDSYGAAKSGAPPYIEFNVIDSDFFLVTHTIDPNCPLIFVEDKVWLEGEVSTKVSLAVADVDSPGVDPSIVLNGNITYTSTTSGLLAIAEEDVSVGLVVPDDMGLNGIFIAQNGQFGRNYYCPFWRCTWWWNDGTGWKYQYMYMPPSLRSYAKRNSLTINGTIVSNGSVGTQWGSGDGYSSGFEFRVNSYDRDLVDNPPPLAPKTSDDYKFVDWREVR